MLGVIATVITAPMEVLMELIEWLSSTNMHILNKGNEFMREPSLNHTTPAVRLNSSKVKENHPGGIVI